MPDDDLPRITDKKLLYGRLWGALVFALGSAVTALLGFERPGFFLAAAILGIAAALIVHIALQSGRLSTDSEVRELCRRISDDT